MSKRKYVIKKNDIEENLLYQIEVSDTNTATQWTKNEYLAIHFENKEEAQATITFIGAVFDWELEEQLEIRETN